ncbi:MAG: putrescine/spermidine ABC transporter permease, partial [Bauldia sp.]|nr:putrescine/spermidine ABC transporter permease [Bauldia sp.]
MTADTQRAADRRRPSPAKWLVVALPYLWLFVLFLIPFAIVIKISFSLTAIAQPPYTPVLDLSAGLAGLIEAFKEFTVENYVWLTEDSLYFWAYISSIEIALVSTALVLLVGY